MDLLQISLIFLIMLLGVFLSLTGLQVFFILKNLTKTLKKLNQILEVDEEVNKLKQSVKKSSRAASTAHSTTPSSRRFFKKTL